MCRAVRRELGGSKRDKGDIQYALYSIHYTVYIIQYTLYSIHYTVYIIQYTLYSIHYTVYIIQYTLYRHKSGEPVSKSCNNSRSFRKTSSTRILPGDVLKEVEESRQHALVKLAREGVAFLRVPPVVEVCLAFMVDLDTRSVLKTVEVHV